MVRISCPRSSKWVAKEWRKVWQPAGFDEAGAPNGLLHRLLDLTRIDVVATLLGRGPILPAVSLRKHPLPAPLPIGMAVLSLQGMGQHHRSLYSWC